MVRSLELDRFNHTSDRRLITFATVYEIARPRQGAKLTCFTLTQLKFFKVFEFCVYSIIVYVFFPISNF